MTSSSSEKDQVPPGEKLAETTSIRELMGLEVKHLLPGLAMAAKMLKQGDQEGALRTYATLVLCEPSEPRFQIGLAACALKIGNYAVALQAASAVIAFTRESPEGYHLSAHACVGLGDYDSAIDDFKEALQFAQAVGNTVIASDCERMLARVAIMKERKGSADSDPAQNDEAVDTSAIDSSAISLAAS